MGRLASPTRVSRTCTALLGVVMLSVLASTADAATRSDRRGLTRVAKVVVVVFENKAFPKVIGDIQAPTFDALAGRSALLTGYRGVAHPSLPNYLALVSGSTHGVTTDCTSCRVSAPNLADELERAGKTWRTYAEGLPAPGFAGASAGRYAKKHDALLYFDDVTARPDRLRRIVPLTMFRQDLASHQLPDFSLVVPDLCHDMHDCPVSTGDAVFGAALYLTTVGLFGVGIGAIIRNTAGGIAAFAGILFVLPPLMNVLPTSWNNAASPYLPLPAGQAVMSLTRDPHQLAPWTGLGLLVAYTAAALAIAAALLVRRDT